MNSTFRDVLILLQSSILSFGSCLSSKLNATCSAGSGTHCSVSSPCHLFTFCHYCVWINVERFSLGCNGCWKADQSERSVWVFYHSGLLASHHSLLRLLVEILMFQLSSQCAPTLFNSLFHGLTPMETSGCGASMWTRLLLVL